MQAHDKMRVLKMHEVTILNINERSWRVYRSTLESSLTVQYAALVSQFTIKARAAVRKLASAEGDDDLRLIRIRSSLHEVIVAPDFDKVHDYQLIVIQDPSTQ